MQGAAKGAQGGTSQLGGGLRDNSNVDRGLVFLLPIFRPGWTLCDRPRPGLISRRPTLTPWWW